jgi:alkylhydroperoxidase family enzyme
MGVVVSEMSGRPDARVPFVDDPGPPAREVFDGLRQAGRPVPNLYRVLANSPTILKAWVDFAWPLRAASAPRGLRELAVAYLATRRGSEYVRTHHSRYARRHGTSDTQLASLRTDGWDPEGPWSDVERLALTLVDEIVAEGSASEATVDEMRKSMGDQHTVELVVTVAFYEAVCAVNRSFAIPIEPGTPPVR